MPLGQASATFIASPGGPQLPAFAVPDATPLNSTARIGCRAAGTSDRRAVPASVTELRRRRDGAVPGAPT